MPDISTIALFALACVALTATPGPDMLLIATRSAVQGRMAGLATFLGIATGTYCHAIALALGLSHLFASLPLAYDIVRITGALYLLFLAYQAFTQNHNPPQQGAKPTSHSAWIMYRQGLLTNILNPKVVLFFLALFPQFLDPAAGNIALQVMILTTILNSVGFIVNGIVILSANKAGTMMQQNQRLRNFGQYFTGFIFTALAARLVFDGSSK
jgi:threonine/homoserine/homoserine lactone efflux protein